jgi:hypothetical protein
MSDEDVEDFWQEHEPWDSPDGRPNPAPRELSWASLCSGWHTPVWAREAHLNVDEYPTDTRVVLGNWLDMAYRTGFEHAIRMDGREARRLTGREKMLILDALRVGLTTGRMFDYVLARELLSLLPTADDIVVVNPATKTN